MKTAIDAPITITPDQTLADVFLARVNASGDTPAYRQYEHGQWNSYTWSETCTQVARWQHALREEGLIKGDRVAIMCSNNWAWVLFDQAAQGIGLVTVPVYTNDRSENICWILKDAGCQLLLIENQSQWDALDRHAPEITQLQRIVSLARLKNPSSNVLALDEWLCPECKNYILSPGNAEDLATIVYTSGTTGRPKGVMLSHRNILFNISAILHDYEVSSEDLFLSFLPLSHTLERTVGYYLPIVTGSCVAFNRSIPLLAEDLVKVKPSIMISVPRIFERVYSKIKNQLANGSAVKQKLFKLAVDIGWLNFQHQQGRHAWHPALLAHSLLDHLVGSKIRQKLGGNLRFTVCGGAALSPEVARVFIGLGIPVLQGYGMTEASPVIACNRQDDNIPHSVGLPLAGVEVTTDHQQQLLTRSPSVMMGYWGNPNASLDTVNTDGWLKTGDIVDIDELGHIQITGRIKDIIVLANGEKMPPSDIENAIILDKLIEQVLVIGEAKPYLSALVVPNPEELAAIVKNLQLNLNDPDLLSHKALNKIVKTNIQERMRSFPGYAQIRRICLIEEAWTPENGLATPTLKLRRERIMRHHAEAIAQMYAGY